MWFLCMIELPTLIISLIAAFATIGAAIAAFLAAYHTKKTAQGQLMIKLLNEYSGDKMMSDIRLLKEWEKECNKLFIEEFIKQYKTTPKGRRVDNARRRFSHYCKKTIHLKDNKNIDDKTFKIILPSDTEEIYKKIAKPLDDIIKENE